MIDSAILEKDSCTLSKKLEVRLLYLKGHLSRYKCGNSRPELSLFFFFFSSSQHLVLEE